MSNIEELVQKISEKTGLSRGEIKNKIEKKKEELGFFVNDIAAAHIIAKDLNVTLGRPELKKKPKITIKNLKNMEPGLSGISLTGIILRVYSPIEFVKKGSKGILAPVLLHDGTGRIRTILWGNMTRLIIDKKIEKGSIIKIDRAYTRKGINNELELHVGDRGAISIETEVDVQNYPNPEDEILNLDVLDDEMGEIDVRAIVHKVGNLVTFSRSDGSEGKVSNLFLKGKLKIRRMVFWDAQAEKAFNYTRGDELLIQAVNVKLDREGNPELHATRATYIIKTGHTTLPSLEEPAKTTSEPAKIVSRTITNIDPNDGLISLTARKGPETKIKNFKRKDGRDGSVKRSIIFDHTGSTSLVLWDEAINSFDDLNDSPFKINKVRVNISRYKSIELHTLEDTEFTSLEISEISEDPPIQDISEVKPIQGLASVQGVIQSVSDIREFNRSDGSTGRVASVSIQDTTGTCRIVAWDETVEKFVAIQEQDMKFAKIFFGRIQQNDDDLLEVHLSPQSHIRLSSRIPNALRNIEIIKKDEPERISQEGPDYKKIQLSDLTENEDGSTIEILGKLIRVFQQTPYYWACPECRKKVVESEELEGWVCATHNKVTPNLTMRISGLIDDSTSTIPTTFFGRSGEILTGMSSKDIQNLIDINLTDDEIFEKIQQESEGKTLQIQGRIQLQTREVQGETMQSQTLFANRVSFPPPKQLVNELIKDLQQS